MEETTYDQREAIRTWSVHVVTSVIDTSEEWLLELLRETARTAVRDDMGTGMGRDEYAAMLAGRGQTDRWEYERVVGIAVRDALSEHLGELADQLPEGSGNLIYRLLVDVLDLYDSRQADHFGAHYLPESVDEIDWTEEDEDEDEEDEDEEDGARGAVLMAAYGSHAAHFPPPGK